jgi:hypothetical protein
MRHTVAPSVSISYAPKPSFWGSADEARTGVRESFFVNLSLIQDVDVKMPLRRERDEDDRDEENGGEEDGAAAADTTAPAVADTTAAGIRAGAEAGAEAGADEEQDRPPEVPTRTVNLLNVS